MMQIKFSERVVVITDASCFIILHKIDALDLLHQLFSTILTTPEIAEEYGIDLPEWVTVISLRDKKLQNDLAEVVDPGEASAIALAHEIESNFLITDDLQARKLAAKLGLTIIGTLGILLRAKQKSLIVSLAPYLEKISKTNFRISAELIDRVLREAGEK